jgi:transcriptional regulator with XRE-family HTH domain
MEKSTFTDEYEVLLRCLREARRRAAVTQVQLAERLEQTQPWVSKCERGERRIDVVELRAICRALGTTLPDFVRELEEAFGRRKRV